MNEVLNERTRADGHKDGQTDRVIRKVRFAPKKHCMQNLITNIFLVRDFIRFLFHWLFRYYRRFCDHLELVRQTRFSWQRQGTDHNSMTTHQVANTPIQEPCTYTHIPITYFRKTFPFKFCNMQNFCKFNETSIISIISRWRKVSKLQGVPENLQ